MIWQHPNNCLLTLVEQKSHPGRKQIQQQIDASPGGQAASSQPVNGQTASWPTVEPTLQLGSEAILGPGSRRPTALRAGLPARRPARRLPAGRQPGGHPEPQPQPATEPFWTTVSQKQPDPGKTPEGKKIGEQPGHRAGRPAGQPAAPSQLALGQPASRMTVSRLTVQAGSEPTGWLPAAIRPAS